MMGCSKDMKVKTEAGLSGGVRVTIAWQEYCRGRGGVEWYIGRWKVGRG